MRLIALVAALVSVGCSPSGCSVTASRSPFFIPFGFFSPQNQVAEAVVLDFTQASAPTGATVARADSATVYPANSTVTGVTATTGPVRECRTLLDGTIGCGWWVWPSIPANLITAANHCTTGTGFTGWTLQGALTTSCASVTGPDGVANSADSIYDSSTGAQQYEYIGAATGNVVAHSVWAKVDSPTPTAAGGLQASLGSHHMGANFTLPGGSWQRLDALNEDIDEYHTLVPAGYTRWTSQGQFGSIDAAATGKIDVWGDYESVSSIDYPRCDAGTGKQTIELSSATAAKFVSGGDFTASVRWISELAGDRGFQPYPTASVYVFYFSTPDGELSLHWDGTHSDWELTVRGVTLSAGASTIMPGWPHGVEMSADVWYLVSTGKWGIRITVGGASDSYFTGGTTTGTALAAPTDGWIGSNNLGASNMAGMITTVRSNFARPSFNQSIENFGEFLLIGDSISERVINQTLSGGAIYSTAESRTRGGIITLARAGDTCAQQQARFDASPAKTNTSIKAVEILCGINDLLGTSCAGASCTDVQVETALTSLYNDVHTALPAAKINITALTPCNNYPMTAQQYTYWQNVNTWIRANSLGADHVDDAIRAALNDPTNADSMPPEYTGDHLHPLNNGRLGILSPNWRADFHTMGAI